MIQLETKDFIMPYFVTEGKLKKKAIKSMPGIFHISIDNLVKDVARAREVGIGTILLFGVADSKDKTGSLAYKNDGTVQKAIRAVKEKVGGDLVVITDVCLCGYTSHGHCGIIKNKKIDNDATLKALSKIAVSHAEAGADFGGPQVRFWHIAGLDAEAAMSAIGGTADINDAVSDFRY